MNNPPASIGIDLGGTNTKVGMLIGDALQHTRSFPTQSFRPRDKVLEDIVGAVASLQKEARDNNITVAALGIGVPATINVAKGQTLIMPNFAKGWFGFSVVDYLQEKTELATSLINDARAFVLAETKLGVAKDYDDVFGIILGTGVGGGVVINKTLHIGNGALAGEIGHHIVDPQGVRCGCGSVGCLETVASAPALVASVTRPFLHGRCPILFELTEGDLSAISAATITQAARQGDTACKEALERVGFFLGLATANAMTLLAPECIVVGGGLAGASDLLFPTIQETWQRYLQVVGELKPELLRASLEQPGVLGAALYAREGRG